MERCPNMKIVQLNTSQCTSNTDKESQKKALKELVINLKGRGITLQVTYPADLHDRFVRYILSNELAIKNHVQFFQLYMIVIVHNCKIN